MRVSAPGHHIRAKPQARVAPRDTKKPPSAQKGSGCSMPFLTRPCYRPCKKFISKNSPAILTRFDRLHLHAGDTWPCVGSHKLVEVLELPVHISFACTCLPAPLDATLPSLFRSSSAPYLGLCCSCNWPRRLLLLMFLLVPRTHFQDPQSRAGHARWTS